MVYVGNTITALASVFLGLSTLTVAARIYVRGRLLRAIGTDDYVMAFAYLCFLGYLISQLIGVKHGIGKHYWDLDLAENEIALKCWWICEVFYAPATSLLKISVGFFLLRLTIIRWQIWVIRLIIAGSAACGSVYFLLIIFQCHPISFWWDLDPTKKGTCIDATAFAICGWIISVLNTVADLTFAIVPMFLVRQTQMSQRTRVLVCILLGIASLAGIVTIVRMPYIHTLDHYKGDFLYNTVNVAFLTTLEVGLGITAANLATLRPLVQKLRHRSATSTPRPPSLPLASQSGQGGIQKTTVYSATVSAAGFGDSREALHGLQV